MTTIPPSPQSPCDSKEGSSLTNLMIWHKKLTATSASAF